MGVGVTCGMSSGIIVAVNVGERGDSRRITIVAVGEIGVEAGAQELMKNKKIRRFDARFI